MTRVLNELSLYRYQMFRYFAILLIDFLQQQQQQRENLHDFCDARCDGKELF